MRKFVKRIANLLVIATCITSLAGCNDAAQSASTKNTTGLKTFTEPTVNKDKVLTMAGGWSKPPAFRGNYYNSDGSNSAYSYLYERLVFIPHAGAATPILQLADKVENTQDQTIVTLKKNIKWHDGEPFTAKDIWAFYKLINTTVSKYVTSIDAKDDYTVVFNWQKPVVCEDMREKLISMDLNGTVPYHIYKKYADRADEIDKMGTLNTDSNKLVRFNIVLNKDQTKMKSDNYNAFVNDGGNKPIGTGPFKFESVDDNQLILVKNQDYWDAKDVHFEKIKQIQSPSDLSQYYAMLRDGDLDVDWSSPPKDILDSNLNANPDLVSLKYMDMASYGLIFNTRKAPFDNVKFRQAISYIIDKTKVREVGNYYGKEFNKISAIGFPPTMMKDTMMPEVKLTDFTRSEDKATSLLKEIGWSKGSDGMWKDASGKKASFIIGSDSGWDVTLNSAQVVAEQLTKFGIDTKVKAVDSSVFYDDAGKGTYDMIVYLVDMCWNMKEPWDGLNNAYNGLKDYIGLPDNLTVKGYDGSEFDPRVSLKKYLVSTDKAEQKKIINNLAYAYNENCYVVNLFQTTYGVIINLKNIDGNFPGEDKFEKYNRNLPVFVTDDPKLDDQIVQTSWDFLMNIKGYWPK